MVIKYKPFHTLSWAIECALRGTYRNNKSGEPLKIVGLWRPLRFGLTGQLGHQIGSALREDFWNGE